MDWGRLKGLATVYTVHFRELSSCIGHETWEITKIPNSERTDNGRLRRRATVSTGNFRMLPCCICHRIWENKRKYQIQKERTKVD